MHFQRVQVLPLKEISDVLVVTLSSTVLSVSVTF